MDFEYDLSVMGLGSVIGLYSLVQSTDKSFQFNVSPNWRTPNDLKRLFSIPDNKIFVNVVNRPISTDFSNSLCDNAKVFSPYIKAGTPKKNKPCIGIALAGDTDFARLVYLNKSQNIDLNLIPSKYSYGRQDIDKIIELSIDAGYDIITLNSSNTNLDEKFYLINNLCDCVIGLESGVAHLAHCLTVPVIMFPWKGNNILPMIMHLDSKTYFLKENEINEWTVDTLIDTIRQLYNGNGNNHFLKNPTIDFDSLLVPHGLREFIQANIKELKLGGIVKP